MNNIKNIAITALEAGLDLIFIGEENSGKFTLAKIVANGAPVINGSELTNENIVKLQQVFANNQTVILRGINQQNSIFIKPIIESKSILATPIKTQFIITATENIAIKNIFALTTPKHSKDGWIEWARISGVNQKVIELIVNNDGFFEQHGTDKLSLLDKIIKSNIKNSQLLIDLITHNQEIATHLITRDKTAYPDLLDMLKTKEPSDLITIIKQNNSPAALLASIVTDPRSIGLIDMAIKDSDIQKSIDNLLLELN